MKTDRINGEITRTKEKINDLQSRLKDLERQKTEIENTDIVAVVRSANVSHQELIAFVRAYKIKGAAAESMLVNDNGAEKKLTARRHELPRRFIFKEDSI